MASLRRPAAWRVDGGGTGATMRWLAACGIVVPVIDGLVTVWLGALDPGYSHARQYISELGEEGRPRAAVFNAWCVLYGLLLAPFALALRRGMGGGKVAWLRPGTFLALAVLGVPGGVFPCDPGCEGRTPAARVHHLTGEAGVIGVLLAPFLAWAGMRGNEAWRGYRAFTLAAGCLVVAAGGWPAVCHWASPGRDACPVGAAQRVLLGVWYVWRVVVAVRLSRFAAAGEPAGGVTPEPGA